MNMFKDMVDSSVFSPGYFVTVDSSSVRIIMYYNLVHHKL